MKKQLQETIEIPEGVSCTFKDNILTCQKGSVSISRELDLAGIDIKLSSNSISLDSKGNKNNYKTLKSYVAHIKNMLYGLSNEFVYELESCNVHFPMTLKMEKDILMINNFLGEKVPRTAKILPNVKVDIKGQKIILSSHDIEALGHTLTNLEKATKIKNRDRRIFQDGIFLTNKSRGVSNA